MRKYYRALTLLIILLPWLCSSAPAGATAPETTCASHSCLYLPLIAYHPQIILIAPSAGARIGSLAPVLAWQPAVAGGYRIQVSEDSAFAPTSNFALSTTTDVKLPLPAQMNTLITSNLKPQQTYYWRIEKTGQESTLITAASEYFTTPVKDASLLPPGVQLLTPANNSSIAAQNASLVWQSVPGALYYRIRVYDSNNLLVSGPPAAIYGAITWASVPKLVPGMTYHWKVKALNAYGWGPYLPDHYFKVT
jgi:hypothetical protein